MFVRAFTGRPLAAIGEGKIAWDNYTLNELQYSPLRRGCPLHFWMSRRGCCFRKRSFRYFWSRACWFRKCKGGDFWTQRLGCCFRSAHFDNSGFTEAVGAFGNGVFDIDEFTDAVGVFENGRVDFWITGTIVVSGNKMLDLSGFTDALGALGNAMFEIAGCTDLNVVFASEM